jgi:hypothetical protein
MLTQEFVPEVFQEIDRETKRYLTEILAQEQTTLAELIRNLIRDRWNALNPNLCETLQPIPITELDASTGVTRRKSSKQVIAEFMHRKCRSPHSW